MAHEADGRIDAPSAEDGPTPRDRLLRAAFDEIYQHGYQGARVDAILDKAGLTKGGFYYYFKSKTELGYAVVDELIATLAERIWRDALSKADDPIDGIIAALGEVGASSEPDFIRHGCPINNLSQEMSALDEGFRARLREVFARIVSWIADSLRNGQENGIVRPDIDCTEAATFVVAAAEGCISLAKNDQTGDVLDICRRQIEAYLNTLRP